MDLTIKATPTYVPWRNKRVEKILQFGEFIKEIIYSKIYLKLLFVDLKFETKWRESEFNEFNPRLKFPKNRFQLSAGLNFEYNVKWNQLYLSRRSNSLNSASDLLTYITFLQSYQYLATQRWITVL